MKLLTASQLNDQPERQILVWNEVVINIIKKLLVTIKGKNISLICIEMLDTGDLKSWKLLLNVYSHCGFKR